MFPQMCASAAKLRFSYGFHEELFYTALVHAGFCKGLEQEEWDAYFCRGQEH